MMRVIIGCESSGVVRDAFTARGHFARSVDLLPTDALSQSVTFRSDFGCYDHTTFDPTCEACEHDEPWCHRHGMFAYECPCLGPTEDEAEYAETCEQGARHLSGDLFSVEDIEGYDVGIFHPPCTHLTVAGARWFKGKEREQAEGIAFAERIWDLPIEKMAIENPIGVLSTRSKLGKPTQIIQPWMFGHPETKATCLWLRGLPPLVPTNNVRELMLSLPAKERHRIHYMSPGPNRWKERSKTFQGIADAMAEQWGVIAPAAFAPSRGFDVQGSLFAGVG